MRRFPYIMLFLMACGVKLGESCDYEVTSEFIESDCSMSNGIKIHKLTNVVLDETGSPSKYDVEVRAHYSANTDKAFGYHSDHGLSKISFKEKIDGYLWSLDSPTTVLKSSSPFAVGMMPPDDFFPVSTSESMPFSLEPGNWYLLDGLYEGGVPKNAIFVFINKDGSLAAFRQDRKTRLNNTPGDSQRP